ncbi:MAG: hypothetical protein EXS35_14860 [Pedosphaera sp.]|nr:hypothetical protein [Pedosphaera sp.]
MKFGKVKQQRRVLLVALYLFRKLYGIASPHKRKVLRFIRSRGLLHIPAKDEETCAAGEMIWEHELSWHRNSLKNEGFIRMPEIGIWQMTEFGERDVEDWAQRIKQMTDSKPDWVADFKVHSDPEAEFEDQFHYEFYITEETVQWGAYSGGCRTVIPISVGQRSNFCRTPFRFISDSVPG